jgi:hypothetical protein
MKRPALALSLSSVVSLCGCAITPAAVTTVGTEGDVPAGARRIAPLIVAAEGDIELQGPELAPEARARFLEERSERIKERSRVDSREVTGRQFGDACFRMGIVIPVVGAIACPFAMLGAVASMELGRGVARGVKYVAASIDEPSLRLSPDLAASIASALRERATSAALVERATSTAPRDFENAERPESLLVLRMKAARICEAAGSPAICLVAEAQGFLGDGAALTPTQHVFVHGPITLLAPADGAHLERTIEQALGLLARSIVAAYTGGVPSPDAAPEPAPTPLAAVPVELRKLTDAERSVFPQTFTSGCIRERC